MGWLGLKHRFYSWEQIWTWRNVCLLRSRRSCVLLALGVSVRPSIGVKGLTCEPEWVRTPRVKLSLGVGMAVWELEHRICSRTQIWNRRRYTKHFYLFLFSLLPLENSFLLLSNLIFLLTVMFSLSSVSLATVHLSQYFSFSSPPSVTLLSRCIFLFFFCCFLP